MLRPIPARILKQTIYFKVCSGVDVYQNPTYEDLIEVTKVCIQPANETKKTVNNTEVVLRSILFISKTSVPNLDIDELKAQSEGAGKPLQVVFQGQDYTVLTVDTMYDDTGNYHHTEVGLV